MGLYLSIYNVLAIELSKRDITDRYTIERITGEVIELLPQHENWKPTAENINNLPEKIRDYIKELGTTSDPAGIIQDNACLLENVIALTRKCKILKVQIDLMSFFVPTDKMNKIEKDAEISQPPL